MEENLNLPIPLRRKLPPIHISITHIQRSELCILFLTLTCRQGLVSNWPSFSAFWPDRKISLTLELGKKVPKVWGELEGFPSIRTLDSHHPVLVVSQSGHWIHTILCSGSCLLNSELLQHIPPAFSGPSGGRYNRVRSGGSGYSLVCNLTGKKWPQDHSAGWKVEFSMIGGVILMSSQPVTAWNILSSLRSIYFLLHDPSSLPSIESSLCFKLLSLGSAFTSEKAQLIISGPQRTILLFLMPAYLYAQLHPYGQFTALCKMELY